MKAPLKIRPGLLYGEDDEDNRRPRRPRVRRYRKRRIGPRETR